LAFNLLQPVVSGAADSSRTAVPQHVLAEAVKYIGGAALEAQGVDTRNSVAKLLAGRRRHGVDKYLDITSAGAIDGWYIRMQRGRLGLQRTSVWQAGINWLKSCVTRVLFRSLFHKAR